MSIGIVAVGGRTGLPKLLGWTKNTATRGSFFRLLVRGTYECVEITEDHVLLRRVAQDEDQVEFPF